MKLAIALILVLMATGCTSPTQYVTYPQGVPIRVTAGYYTPKPEFHVEGDEFVFSVILPPSDEWRYAPKYYAGTDGMLKMAGKRFRQELMIEWSWESERAIEKRTRKAPIYLPWYSGQIGDGKRIPYTPTEEQLKYGDWYSAGYPQEQFHQSMYKGRKKYYCGRSLSRRGGRTTWQQEQGVPDGAGYSLVDLCGFRTTDGRDASLAVRTRFSISTEEFKANPNALDQRLDELDAFLEPMWDSLEVMPTAYQFDPPPQVKGVVPELSQ